MELSRQFQQEAEFSDKAYSQHASELDINPRMFIKYSHPKNKWDARQFCAQWLGKVEGKELLDYGCGMGEESIYFAKLGAQVTAIDVSPVGIDLVLRRAAHNNLSERVRAFQMDACATSFDSESFDLVHGLGILHHICVDRGLREVRRLLKPGGRGVFLEHMMNSRFLEKLKGRFFEAKADHTEYERPVRWDECRRCSGQFSQFQLAPYFLMSRLRRHISILDNDATLRIDYAILRAMPALRHLAGIVIICVQK